MEMCGLGADADEFCRNNYNIVNYILLSLFQSQTIML